MEFWMEGLDAAIHHLGKASDIGDIHNAQSGFAKCFCGAAGRYYLDAKICQLTGKFDNAGFIRNRDQSSPDLSQFTHKIGKRPKQAAIINYNFYKSAKISRVFKRADPKRVAKKRTGQGTKG